MAKGNFLEAYHYLSRAFEKDQKNHTLAYTISLALWHLKDFDEAKNILFPFLSKKNKQPIDYPIDLNLYGVLQR
jgi:tetratricopeptide (TPR) repeat protein